MSIERVENAKNRVFEQDFAIGKNLPQAMSTDEDHVYRRSGMHQIEDIILTGYVRPKEKVQGGHKLEVFWTHGGKKLFYYGGAPILEVPASLLKDGQIGAISISDLSGVWLFDTENNKYVNRLDHIKQLYNEYQQSIINNCNIDMSDLNEELNMKETHRRI